MLRKKVIIHNVCILIGVIIFYIGFLHGYLDEREVIREYQILKAQVETRFEQLDISYNAIQNATKYEELNTSFSVFDWGFGSALDEFAFFVTENSELLSKGVDPNVTLQEITEKRAIYETEKEDIVDKEKVFLLLHVIDTNYNQIESIKKELDVKDIDHEKAEQLYEEILDLLYETQESIEQLQFIPSEFSGTYQGNTFNLSFQKNETEKWIKEQQQEINKAIVNAEDQIIYLNAPIYNVIVNSIYDKEIMFGYLINMEALEIPPLVFTITNKRNTPITLDIHAKIAGYTSKVKEEVLVRGRSEENVSFYFTPLPNVDVTEKTAAQLEYEIYENDSLMIEDTVEVAIQPKNVMAWNFKNDTINNILIASFVTPHAPEVKELVRLAAEFSPGTTMSSDCGWCQASNDWRLAMEDNVKAIYNALKFDYDVTYVNTLIAYNGSSEVIQTVYLPSEVMGYSSANCIDGTVTFASALEAIGIDAYIVLAPGHAYLCYDLSPQDHYYYPEQCLETTVINDDGFNDAVEKGNDLANAGFYEMFISVREARELGILPIE